MRKHLKIGIKEVEVFGRKRWFIKILEQTHRGDDFGDNERDFHNRDYEFAMCSSESEGSAIEDDNMFLVRGETKYDDNNILICDSEDYINRLKSAVRAYNKHFSSEEEKRDYEVVG